jgi:uncharacterized protein YqeY
MIKKMQELRRQELKSNLKDTLTMILDGAQKIAKQDKNRMMTDEDITTSAFNFKKVLLEEEEYAKLKEGYSKEDYEAQFSLISQFLEESLTEDQVIDLITETFNEKYSEKSKKTMGLLIKDIKEKTKNRFEEKQVSLLVKQFIEE